MERSGSASVSPDIEQRVMLSPLLKLFAVRGRKGSSELQPGMAAGLTQNHCAHLGTSEPPGHLPLSWPQRRIEDGLLQPGSVLLPASFACLG